MTEYVPTTGVIRAAYQIARDTEDNLVSFNEFHSWLEKHDAEITAEAEQRIIKLLEALATHKDCQLGEHHEDYVWNSPLGIIEVLTKWDGEPKALIKGEQK